MNTLIGQTVKNYKIVKLIGQGGMAQVYGAQHIESGHLVAMKVLHPHLVDQADFLQRFYREAKAVSRLKHPNIIHVYGFAKLNQLKAPCLVMEFIKGPTLQQCLQKAAQFGEKWTPLSIVHLLEPLASAIDYAHKQRMLHRDIKPSNIVLQPLPPTKAFAEKKLSYTLISGACNPILMDFGLAQLVDDTRLTATGSFAGTPAYISPEQANGERGTIASDIYSLGIVTYEMFTGQVPFQAETPLATMLQHISTVPVSPLKLRPDLNLAIEKVLLKALAKQAEDRYNKAETFVADLKQAIKTGTAPQAVMTQTFTTFMTPTQFRPGNVIDNRYEVERVLKQGTLTQIYKIKDRQVDQITFTLKIINDHKLTLDYLKQEFKRLVNFRHPFIARVMDAGQLNSGQYFLKLEYVSGKTLSDCVAENILSEAQKIKLLENVLEALVYLEKEGFVHGYLKPSAIMVTTNGIKIVDFTISKRLQATDEVSRGDSRYMPPEVSHLGWNKTSDLYTISLIFYELITGRLPFIDITSLATWDIPDPCEFAPSLPQSVAQLLIKALSRQPEDRFPNAASMLANIRYARIEAGVQTRPPTSNYISPSHNSIPDFEHKSSALHKTEVSTKKTTPISLQSVSKLRLLTQRGSGFPILLGQGQQNNIFTLITTTHIETVSATTLQTSRTIWYSNNLLTAATLVPNGKVAIVATSQKQLLTINLTTGQFEKRAIQVNGLVIHLICSYTGEFIAAYLKNGEGLLIELSSGRIIHRWQSSQPFFAFNPAQNMFAFMDKREALCIIKLNPVTELLRLNLKGENLTAIIFSTDGKNIISSGKRLRWWLISNGQEVASAPAPKGGVTTLACIKKQPFLVVATTYEVQLWDLNKKRKIGQIQLENVKILNFVTVNLLYSIQVNGYIHLHHLKNKQLIAHRQFDTFQAVAISPDGETVATGDRDGTVKIWTLANNTPIVIWQPKTEPIWAIAAHPSKPLFAVVGSKTLWLLDFVTQHPISERKIDGVQTHISFSNDGHYLLLQKPNYINLFNLNNPQQKPMQLKKFQIAAFTNDDQILAAIRKSTFYWITVNRGQQKSLWKVHPAQEIAFSHSGQLMALLSPHGQISMWNNKGQHIFNLQDTEPSMYNVKFAPNSLLITALDGYGQLHCWDASIASKQTIIPIHYGKAYIAGYNKEASYLITAGEDGLLRWWYV